MTLVVCAEASYGFEGVAGLVTVLVAPEPLVSVAVPAVAVRLPEALWPLFPVAVPEALTVPLLAVAVQPAVPPFGPVAVPVAVTFPGSTVAVPVAVAVLPLGAVAVALPVTTLPFWVAVALTEPPRAPVL